MSSNHLQTWTIPLWVCYKQRVYFRNRASMRHGSAPDRENRILPSPAHPPQRPESLKSWTCSNGEIILEYDRLLGNALVNREISVRGCGIYILQRELRPSKTHTPTVETGNSKGEIILEYVLILVNEIVNRKISRSKCDQNFIAHRTSSS